MCASQVPACNNPEQILRIRTVCGCSQVCMRGCLCVFLHKLKILWLTHVYALQGFQVGERCLWFLVSGGGIDDFCQFWQQLRPLSSSPHYFRHLPRPLAKRPWRELEYWKLLCVSMPGFYCRCRGKRAMGFKWNVLEQLEWVKILIRRVSLAHFYVSYLCVYVGCAYVFVFGCVCNSVRRNFNGSNTPNTHKLAHWKSKCILRGRHGFLGFQGIPMHVSVVPEI